MSLEALREERGLDDELPEHPEDLSRGGAGALGEGLSYRADKLDARLPALQRHTELLPIPISPHHIQRSPARFDLDKLGWVNQQWLQQADLADLDAELAALAPTLQRPWQAGPAGEAAIALLRPRCRTLKEIIEQAGFLFAAPESYDDKDYAKHVRANTPGVLDSYARRLEAVDDWAEPSLKQAAQETVAECEIGFAKLGMPARLALAGQAQAPALEGILLALGREASLARLRALATHIRAQAA